MSDTYDEIIRRWKNNTQELDPSTYDASYELVTEIIKSYSKLKDFSVCNYNDLNLIYLSTVGTWKHSVEKKKEAIYKSNLSEEEKEHLIDFISSLWERVNNKEFSHSELNDKITFGMFGTGFYNTETKTGDEYVQKFVKMCVDLLPIENDEYAFEIVDKTISNGFKGLAAGGISVILHCLKPFIFPILNSHQGKKNIFEKLGIDIKNPSSEKTYISNSRKIKEYRDANFTWKNYRIFDLENVDSQPIEEEKSKMEQNDKIANYTKILNQKKNIILQGAPGTGKTYNTAALALSICGINISQLKEHEDLMKKYNELQDSGQIGFVTFHQSLDYEDFVEGIKPSVEGDSIRYNVEDGIFKKICINASVSDQEKLTIVDCIDRYIGSIKGFEKKKEIPTLTGRSSFYAWWSEGNQTVSTRSIISKSEKDPEYTPSPLNIEKIKLQALGEGVENNWQQYAQAFINAVKKEYKNVLEETQQTSEHKNYVLIIDEINRGNVSKIFGELITLLEADKRLGGDHPISVTLPYSKVPFSVPSNLYIIGTMNTTDRSVGNIDYAVRRRFAFVTLEADRNILIEKYGEESLNVKLFDAVKTFLDDKDNKSEMDIDDLMVGHSYFMADDENELRLKLEYEIIPLLSEYYKDGIITKAVPKISDTSDEDADFIQNFIEKLNDSSNSDSTNDDVES